MRDSRALLLGFLTLLVVFMVVAEVLGLFNGVDSTVSARTPQVNSLWIEFLTGTAGLAFGVYALAFIIWDVRRRGRVSLDTLNFIVALVAGMILVALLKALTQVPRPGESPMSMAILQALVNADYYAFPSGHATRASILAYFLDRRLPRYRLLWWTYALLIALSRILLHVHWLSDVLFGLILGPWVSVIIESTGDTWRSIYNSIVEKLGVDTLLAE